MNKNTTPSAEPSFEDALTRLQTIVADLEDGTTGLEESMQRFEQGVSLLRQCFQLLEAAEQKIELLTGFDDEGQPAITPFGGKPARSQPKPATTPRAEKSAKPGEDDQRLFS